MANSLTHDFGELLAQSNRLTTETEGNSIYRGVRELNAASQRLANNEKRDKYADNKAEQAAFRLLSQHTFDTEGLTKDVNTIRLKGHYDPLEKLHSTDIEGYLAHHHDMIILTALEEAKRMAEDDFQDTQRRWAADEWTRARKGFMEGLGLRSQPWCVPKSLGKPLQAQLRPKFLGENSLALISNTGNTMSTEMLENRKKPLSTFVVIQSEVISSLIENVYSSSTETRRRKPAYEIANEISRIDFQLDQSNTNSSLSTASDVAGYRTCLELLSSMVGEDGDTPRPCGYFSPLALPSECTSKQEVVDRQSILSLGARRFLERQFEAIIWQRLQGAIQQGQVMIPATHESGSRITRLRTFAVYITKIGAICSPGELRVSEPAISYSDSSSSGTELAPLWLMLFLCLRCGLLREAIDIAKRSWDSGLLRDYGDSSIITVMECISAIDNVYSTTAAASVSMDTSTSPFRFNKDSAAASASAALPSIAALTDAMRGCQNAYQESKALESRDFSSTAATATSASRQYPYYSSAPPPPPPAQQRDPYRLLVLNLLGLVNMDELSLTQHIPAGSVPPGSTLEDFLWGGLWMVDRARAARSLAQQQGQGQGQGVAAAADVSSREYSHLAMTVLPGSSGGIGTNLLPTHNELDIYDRILQAGGDSYFDRSRSHPFKYALILLALQQTGPAIVYLWQAGRTTEAAHLALLALYYGLLPPHTPLESSLSSPSSSSSSSSTPSPADLLRLWTKHILQEAHPKLTVDYLMFLGVFPKFGFSAVRGMDRHVVERLRNVSHQNMRELLIDVIISADREKVSVLVGDLNGDGSRSEAGGHLDRYMDRVAVDMLLADAGHALLTRERESEGALHLYQLAGRYVEVVEGISSQLAQLLVSQDAARAFWVSVARGFFERHLSQGTGFVVQKLENSGRRDCLHTFQCLMQLAAVIDASSQGRHIEALRLLDTLQILPSLLSDSSSSSISLSDAAQQFSRLPPLLLRVADDVLLCAMENVWALHHQVRGDGTLGAIRDAKLVELRRSAGVLVSFAGLVKNQLKKADTLGRLARIEVMIV